MKRIALVLFVMCVQICVCVSAHAQSGATCTNPIPFGKNYSATIQGPCSVWYMGNTFDLPLSVKFYPANNSDKAPEIKLDLTCTPGVYEDEIACKLFCHNQSSYIPLPYTMTPTGKTDSEGHVYYELEIGEFYRDQLLRAGISYNIQVYVEVTYFGGGSINVVPDKLSQCMDTDKWLLLGVTRTVEANDNETYFVAPYASWTNDSIRYVWSGTQPAVVAIGTTCGFDPMDESDPHRLEVMEMDAQDTVKHSNAKILNMQSYALNTTNPAPGAMFYVKAVSDAPGTLKVEHIPAAELNVEAEELVYDQAANVRANDINALYAIPKSWTSATRFYTPTDRIFKMYIGTTPEFGKQDAIATYQFNKSEDGHWIGLTEADMTALRNQATDKYLYVRFECSDNTTVTPSTWTVSDCIGGSTPLEKNTTIAVGARSKVKYRIYYNDWKDGNITFTWGKTSLCKVLISGSCDIGTGNGEGIIAYDELKEGHQSYQLTAEEVSNWASSVDADGYIYMRFYTTVSGGGQMTITSTAPAEEDPEPEPEPETSFVIADGESKYLSDFGSEGTNSVEQITIEPGGQLNVDDSSIQIEELVIQADGTKSGQVHNAANLQAQHVYLEYILNSCGEFASPDRWYAISVPFEVEISEGISRTCDNKSLVSGTDFLIKEYNGALRATQGKGWSNKTEGTLEPGKFYMIGINGNCNHWRFEKKAGQPYEGNTHIAYNEYASSSAKDRGWNGLANTTLEYMRIAGLSSIDYIVLYNNCSGVYVTRLMEETELFVGQPFFIQTSAGGYLNLFYSDGYNPIPARYATAQTTAPLMHFTLTNEKGNTGTDHMYLTMHEDAVPDYTIGRDVARMSTDCKTAAQLWCTMSDNTQLSAHDIRQPDIVTTVDIGLFAPATGKYILDFSARSMDGYEVELLYNGVWVASLHNAQPVTLNLNAGSNSGYSLRVRCKIPASIGDAQRNDVQCTKFINDRQFYIQRGEHIYDAQGKKVK